MLDDRFQVIDGLGPLGEGAREQLQDALPGAGRPARRPIARRGDVAAPPRGKADEQGEQPQELLRRVDLPGQDLLEAVVRSSVEPRADDGRALHYLPLDRPARRELKKRSDVRELPGRQLEVAGSTGVSACVSADGCGERSSRACPRGWAAARRRR